MDVFEAEYGTVTLTMEDRLAHVEFNRPETLNSLTHEMFADLVDAGRFVEARDDVATSPSVCIMRVNPVGAIPTGKRDSTPAIVVDKSTSADPARIAGSNSKFRNASRLPRYVYSSCAPPST